MIEGKQDLPFEEQFQATRQVSVVPASPGQRALSTSGKFLLALLFLMAFISLAVGVRQALTRGIDFQWSGAKLLGEGIDPWKTFINGDPGHRIILGQQPNYLHELYVLLLPVGKLSLPNALIVWCVANLFFVAVSLILISRLYRLTTYHSLLLGALFLMATPLRISFSNGQQSLFALFFFAVAFSVASRFLRGVSLGLAFAKYSFSPVVAIIEVIRLRVATLVGIAIPMLCGLLITWRITGTRLPELLFEPLRSAKIAMSSGYGDIMTILQMILPHFGMSLDRVFSLTGTIGLLCSGVCATYLVKQQFTVRLELALIAVFTLFCFKHLSYDYVFLVFPLAALLEWGQARSDQNLEDDKRNLIKFAAWIPILYLLLFGSVRSRLHLDDSLPFVISNAVSLLLIAGALIAAEQSRRRANAPSGASPERLAAAEY